MTDQPAVRPGARTPLAVAIFSLALGLGFAPPLLAQVPQAQEQGRDFDVPGGSLDRALSLFGQQAGVLISVDARLTEGVRSSGVRGRYSVAEALSILLQHSSLQVRQTEAGHYSLYRAQAAELQPISVSADSGDDIYNQPAAVSRVQRSEYSLDSNALLRSIPGTFTRGGSNQPGISVNIRGMEGYGRVNTMIDGVRQTFRNVAGHSPTGGPLTYVDPNLLAGVDIARGAVSGAHGAGSLMGTANFRTLGLDDVVKDGRLWGTRMTYRKGSNGYGRNRMLAAGVKSELFSDVGGIGLVGAISRTDTYDYENGDDIKSRNYHAANAPESALLKAVLEPGQGHRLELGGRHYKNTFSNGGYPWHMRNETYTANYAYDPGSDWLLLKVNAYANKTSLKYDPRQSGSYNRRDSENQGRGFDISNQSRFRHGDDQWTLNYGVEYFRDIFAIQYQGGNPPGRQEIASLFTTLEWNRDIWYAALGLRHDRYELSGRIPSSTAACTNCPASGNLRQSDASFDPNLTLAVQALPWLQPYLNLSTSFRPPSVQEMFFPLVPFGNSIGNGLGVNPDLKPEEAKNWQAGVNISHDGLWLAQDRLRLKANYFSSDIKNFVVNNFVQMEGMSYATARWVNVPGTTHMRGYEVEGEYDLEQAYVKLSYTDANTDHPVGDGAGLGNGDINILPDSYWTLDLGVRLFEQRLQLGAITRYTGTGVRAAGWETYPDYGQTRKVDSYRTYDLYGSLRVTDNLSLFFNVENVTDEVYSYVLSSEATEDTGRGRTAMVGATLSF